MFSEIYQRNLTAILQHNSFYGKELLETEFSQINGGIVEETSITGSCDVYFNYNEKKYLLHSRYDSTGEAKRIIGEIEETRDYLFIVFGIGLGHHLFELKDKITKGTRVIIVEHNLHVLKYVLTHVDLSPIFNSGQFVLLYGDERQIGKMACSLPGLGLHNLVHNMRVLVLPNYYVYATQNKIALQHISKSLLITVTALGNDLEDHFFGFSNMCHNTEAIMESNSLEKIQGKYKNIPAIVVASGPSLDKNIQHLKNANGKALIIACDASMRACKKHGVRPDAVASIERVQATYTYYYKDEKFPDDLVLLAPGSIWPNILDEFDGKTIIMSRNDNGFEKIWMNNFDNFKFASMGHSCATVAFAAARQAGCNPIILIGQDLAYTSGKKHSNLTHTEYEGKNDDRDSTGIYLEDHEGNLLKSSFVFKLFKEWYELQLLQDGNLQVIDATEGGAYIKGTKLLTLQEAIEQYCTKSIDKRMVDYLPEKQVTLDDKMKKYKELIKIMDRDLNLLNKIKKVALTHMKVLIKMEKNIDENCSDQQLINFVMKLRRGDKIIQKILGSDSLASYYKQIIVQTIAQVKKIGNALTLENVRRNRLLQHNLMFMIAHSTDLIIKEYSDAKTILDKKRQLLIDREHAAQS